MLSWERGAQPSSCGGSLPPCASSLWDTQHAARKAQPKPMPGMEMVFPPPRLLPTASGDWRGYRTSICELTAEKAFAFQPAETLPPDTASRIYWTSASSQTSSSVQLRQKEGGLFRKCQTDPFRSFGKLPYCSERENCWKRGLVS